LIVLVAAIVAWLISSNAGHVWTAIRENELRASVVGLQTYWHKLSAFIVAGGLAGLAGVAYLIVAGIADPSITTSTFTLSLLLMVVVGGSGRIGGAILGGMLYEYLVQRLPAFAGSVGIGRLPGIVRVPLAQPTFILGVVFIIVVIFAPGGLVRFADRFRRRREHTHGDSSDELIQVVGVEADLVDGERH
jgi:branched-chain amino acid transport system permease protein